MAKYKPECGWLAEPAIRLTLPSSGYTEASEKLVDIIGMRIKHALTFILARMSIHADICGARGNQFC